MRRYWTGLFSGVITATLVGLSLALMLGGTGDHRSPAGAEITKPVHQLIQRWLESERAHLQDACAHDVRIERLSLELDSLGDAQPIDATKTARSLAKSHGREVWLLWARPSHALELLGSSGKRPVSMPALELLERATSQVVAWMGPAPTLLLACKSTKADDLWVVQSFAPGELVRDQVHLAWGRAHEGTEVMRVHGTGGSDDLVLRLRDIPSGTSERFELLLALILGSGLVGASLGFLLAREQGTQEVVLAEIERAASRVAEGDLTSTITLRVGGQADQTVRSFDRMTRELREMRTRLAEAERAAAFQDIARRIAHEIKNPLSPIQLAMETLRKAHQKGASGFDEIFDESTKAVLEEVKRLERIVREFSEFARLPKPAPGALALSSLVADLVPLYSPPDVRLVVEQHEGLPNIRVDREQITQVLVNLLQNAFDAARALPVREAVVRVHTFAEDDRVRISIEDSGSGVPTSERLRIFEPYVTDKPEGTGLGLAIVKRILSDHNADIEVGESPLGGARFTVTFAEIRAEDQSASMP